jgi:hypothetical protein
VSEIDGVVLGGKFVIFHPKYDIPGTKTKSSFGLFVTKHFSPQIRNGKVEKISF